MSLRNCLVCLVLSFPVLARAEKGTKDLDGVWKVSLKKTEGWPSERPRILRISQEGDLLKVTDVQTGKVREGKFVAGKVSFPLFVPADSGAKAIDAELTGSFGKGMMQGTAKFAETSMGWNAVKLSSIWVCSNHENPKHTATSEEEMRSQTEQFKCQGWHRLK